MIITYFYDNLKMARQDMLTMIIILLSLTPIQLLLPLVSRFYTVSTYIDLRQSKAIVSVCLITKNFCNCNFISTTLSRPVDSEGAFRSYPNQTATCFRTSSRLAVNTNLFSRWFDSTRNRTHVYRFCSKRSIHATKTDR